MNKILVKLYVPMIEAQYDVKIPVDKKLYQIIYLFIKAIYDLSDGYYVPEDSPQLFEKWTGYKYDVNLTVKENQIKNGTEMVLLQEKTYKNEK